MAKERSRFEPSGLNHTFNFGQNSFQDYVIAMREMIEKARLDLNDTNAEKIIDANSPYEWIPSDPKAKNPKTGRYHCGILFIHGLFDSPAMFDSLFQEFIAKNFLIRAILLPGHGTVPGDLLHIRHEEWSKAAQYGLESFKNQVDHLFVAGFSTGGLLALINAYDHPIDGLILFAPAIKLRTQFAFAVMSTINKFMTQTIGGITWYIKADDTDYVKYQSITLEPAHQVYQLSKVLQELHEAKILDVPVFLVASADDEVISETGILQYFSLLQHSVSRLVYYTTEFIETDDPRIKQISSYYPEKNIISFSHVCLPIAPWHPHYGEQGDFVDHNHFFRLYKRINHQKNIEQDVTLGAASKENIKNYHLKRLTYNPDYENMVVMMNDFIERVRQHKEDDLYTIPYIFKDSGEE